MMDMFDNFIEMESLFVKYVQLVYVVFNNIYFDFESIMMFHFMDE